MSTAPCDPRAAQRRLSVLARQLNGGSDGGGGAPASLTLSMHATGETRNGGGLVKTHTMKRTDAALRDRAAAAGAHEQRDADGDDNDARRASAERGVEQRTTSLVAGSSLNASVQGQFNAEHDLKWNGWGYRDSEFRVNNDGHFYLSGSRYKLSGAAFPSFLTWAEEKVGLDTAHTAPPQPLSAMRVAEPVRCDAFVDAVREHCAELSFDATTRLFHSHGHTSDEIYELRYGAFRRVVDAVVWPRSHEHVERIVAAAHEHNVGLIPFGGGTSVTLALMVPENEQRMVVSVDMHLMRRIKWVDRESMMACIEAGCIGKDLEEQLSRMGLCLGHEPDSHEFSSLGGWISTRASGMKKNVYGNIDDLLLHVKLVTPTGTISKDSAAPRVSTGPDVNQVVLGSEGTLGIITEATLKVRALPEKKVYGSILFPSFDDGVAFMREVARQRIQPASVRLVDNMQFQFGQALKPAVASRFTKWLDEAKKYYVLNIKRFEVERMCAATLVFEGAAVDVDAQQRRVYAIAAAHHGMKAGEENGHRGYFLTYMIAYLRDFGMNHYFLAESFETSVPWNNVMSTCTDVKECIARSAREKGVTKEPFVSARVTQLYDSGAAIYFYFAFDYRGLKDPIKTFEEIESDARDEILAHGGCLSHHHGVGKLRKRWMQQVTSEPGMNVLRSIKRGVDPNNIFCNGNML